MLASVGNDSSDSCLLSPDGYKTVAVSKNGLYEIQSVTTVSLSSPPPPTAYDRIGMPAGVRILGYAVLSYMLRLHALPRVSPGTR